jgi:hypothetical protein
MCPISGGNWNNSSNAGVWTLNCNNDRANSNNNVGFRADSVSPRIAQAKGGAKGGAFRQPQGCEIGRPPLFLVGPHVSTVTGWAL